MRLFIAINLSSEEKTKINNIKDKLKANSSKGKFVDDEHLHITIEFLGDIEKDKVDLIKSLMNEIKTQSFILNPNKIGYFKRREGNIYWLGMEKNHSLIGIYDKLHKRLREEGFKVDNRDFSPHLTLGRRVKLKDGFYTEVLNSEVEKIKIDVNSVDLVKSKFLNGQLRYTVLHSKILRRP
ncbi:MAG: RNA 2',3'-cyclic phosphodiesterase [Tissierellia bacterium]|nr:RNA 2',3'-cyclic phosphodiesterase [Tissierellia bacterium]